MSEDYASKISRQYNQATESLLQGTVTPELAGARLDVAAARLFPDYSRARLRKWIDNGRLLLNGLRAQRPRQVVAQDDSLALRPGHDRNSEAPQAQPIPLDIVYADAALAIVNKPAGLVVHPGAGVPDGTMMNGLLARFPQAAEVPRAGIVHRLDKDTSGLLIVALSLPAHAKLVAALAQRDIHRQYDAIVAGELVAGGTVDAPIGRDPRHRTRMAVTAGGRRAVTHYTVARHYARHTRVDVRLETGRTHQIRVHFAHLHHALVGDSTYGARRLSGVPAADSFKRQALHACRLCLRHPLDGRELEFFREPPPDFQQLVAALEDWNG
ncbi:MAG: 23S rRNA pseudouridine(1911/1915/1917) synthase RluD [Sinobacteraceae bacterium]|nr:23S rRNA pseudouridine(1911/1915/1917) synthase RluD [Nevskiaceae bacterium]